MLNRLIQIAILLFGAAGIATASTSDVLRLDAPHADGLPDLPAPADAGNWGLAAAEAAAGLRYGNASERWNAEIQYPHDLSPALRVSHAFRMTKDVVAGAKLRYGPGLSEMFVNAVYAHKKNLRFRFAAGERRSELSEDGGPPSAQHSYLVSARRISNRGLWTDATITLYAGSARNMADVEPALLASDGIDSRLPWTDDAYFSETRGYALNLRLAPAASTRIDLRYMYSHSSQYFRHQFARAEIDSAGRMRFIQALGACSQLSGGVVEGTASRQVELQWRQSNLRINASKDLRGAEGTSFWVAYSAAFDGPEQEQASCALRNDAEKFDPMLDVAMRRPAEYAYVPLAGASEN